MPHRAPRRRSRPCRAERLVRLPSATSVRRQELRVKMPAHPVRAAQLRHWAKLRGLKLIEAAPVFKNGNRRYPHVCLKGHTIGDADDEVRVNRGGGVYVTRCRACMQTIWREQQRKHAVRRAERRAAKRKSVA